VGHVYSIARSKLSLAQGSSVIHVPREGNSVAHCLAQFARNIVGSQVWLESVTIGVLGHGGCRFLV
jgi:hypothetical protein